MSVPMERRRELIDTPVTLNGEPAKVCGFQLDFPVVRSRKCHAEFAWQTVDHVVKNRDGAFRYD